MNRLNRKFEVYEENGQPKVVVCIEKGDRIYRSVAICSDLDEFDFEIGKRIAIGRLEKLKQNSYTHDYPVNRFYAKSILDSIRDNYNVYLENWKACVC